MPEHIRRVVRATPPEARAIAWLHEALERTDVSEQELLRRGLASDELRARRRPHHHPTPADAIAGVPVV
jgi:hypothetical protein